MPGTPSTGVDLLIDNTVVSTLAPARRFIEHRDAVTHVLMNWGVNDIASGLPVEATWKANYLAIIDYVHTRFPQAAIYIMRPWRRGFDSECATLHTWIDDIVAARQFTAVGPDEAVWLKGSDNGIAETDAGGVHYSAVGIPLAAAAWKAALGY